MDYPAHIRNLIRKFSELPTIGPKTAERIVLHLLSKNSQELEGFSQAMMAVKGQVAICHECGNFSENTLCGLCRDPQRSKTLLCVVAKPQDIIALEKTRSFRGVYHILGGTVNPLEGVHLEKLRLERLLERIKTQLCQEIILAFNPDIEGETTILALVKTLRPFGIKITRLARGLPMGSDIEYADEITLTDALKGRKDL